MPDQTTPSNGDLSGHAVNGANEFAQRPAQEVALEIRHLASQAGSDVAKVGAADLAKAFAELVAQEGEWLAPDRVANVEAIPANTTDPDKQRLRSAWYHWARDHMVHLRTLRLLAQERRVLATY